MHILNKVVLTFNVFAALLMLYVDNYVLVGFHVAVVAIMLALCSLTLQSNKK
jgi:hypothetical protein